MWQKVLGDSRWYLSLLDVDRDLAAAAREEGCASCGSKLHSADFPRKARGICCEVGGDFDRRFSFCCAKCRKRRTPPSVRFLGRRVYIGAAVVLGAMLAQGATRKRFETVRALLGVSARTVERWIAWWRSLPETAFWKEARGQFASPPERGELPRSLLDRFQGSGSERLSALLRFVSPLSVEQAR